MPAGISYHCLYTKVSPEDSDETFLIGFMFRSSADTERCTTARQMFRTFSSDRKNRARAPGPTWEPVTGS